MRAALVAIVVVLTAACGHDHKKDRPASGGLPPLVPASAALVVTFDLPENGFAGLAELGGFSRKEADALADDLAGYIEKSTGVNVELVRRGALFVAPEGGALILSDVAGDWKAPPPGGPIAAARTGRYLVVGTQAAVDAALAVARKEAPGLAADSPLATLYANEAKGAAFAIAADMTALPAAELQEMAARFGVTHAFVSMGGGRLHLAARGDHDKLVAAIAAAEGQMAGAAHALELQRNEIVSTASTDKGIDLAALGTIFAARSMKHFADTFHPKVVGGVVRHDFVGAEATAMLAAAGLGVAAGIAVPAFQKYTAKSRTMEAVAGTKKIYDGARAHALEHGKFPPSQPLAPATPCCTQPGGVCAAGTPSWPDLSFVLEDPHAYQYEYVSDGTSFTARALGDLDCDGELSTFEMAGALMPDGVVKGSAGIYKNQELE